MNGETDRVDLLAIDNQWLAALGDHRFGNVTSTDARDFYFFAAGEAHFVGHLHRNLNERLRHELNVHGIVFGPVMIKLGQSVGRADNRVTVLGGAVFVVRGFETLDHRIVRLLRMEKIVNRTFDRFVVLGERSIGKGRERRKDSTYALRVHDERAHVIFWLGIDLEVRHVVADPFLLFFVPPDLFSRWIPGLAVNVTRRAIVEDAAIRRPGPAPSRMHTQTRRIGGIASRRLIAGFGEGAGVNPVAARRRTIIFQPREARKLLAGLDLLLSRGILQIRERLAVDFLQYLGQRWARGVAVIPRNVQDGIGELAAFLLVQFADLQENLRHDGLVQPGISCRWQGRIFP